MRVFVAWLAIVSCACGARTELGAPAPEDASVVDATEPHDAAPEEAPPIDDAGTDAPLSPLCTAYDAGAPASPCTAPLHVGAITPSSATCYVDLIVHEGDEGTALFDCDGGGWAEAHFAGGTFTGAIQNGEVDLCSGTTFPWSDGCTWASAQRISGNLESKTLTFTYDEQPIAGTGCESACSATGTVLVQ